MLTAWQVMCEWQATSALHRGLPRDLTQSRKSRRWNVAGYSAIWAIFRPASRAGELSASFAPSPVSTQPRLPLESHRT